MTKFLITVLTLIVLTSCTRLHPPDWLHGQWKNKTSKTNNAVWTIDKNEIHFKDDQLGSTTIIDRSEIKETNRYIIRTDHAAEKQPYFQVFKRTETDEIIYYDSSVVIPRQEYTLTKVNNTAAGNH